MRPATTRAMAIAAFCKKSVTMAWPGSSAIAVATMAAAVSRLDSRLGNSSRTLMCRRA